MSNRWITEPETGCPNCAADFLKRLEGPEGDFVVCNGADAHRFAATYSGETTRLGGDLKPVHVSVYEVREPVPA